VNLHAVQKRSLPDKVFEQLLAQIVSGRYEPGATIPPERELSEVLGVNRHVVREALKRLQQMGLVRVVQGGGTKVLDFRRTAGLDLLAVLADHAEAVEQLLPLLVAALETRTGIGVEVSRLCAERSGREVGEELLAIGEELAAVAHGPELLPLDERFWRVVLDGAGNLAYQLAFNSLLRAVHARVDFSVPWLEQELARGDYRRPIAAAIASSDPEAAARATREALSAPPDSLSLDHARRTSR